MDIIKGVLCQGKVSEVFVYLGCTARQGYLTQFESSQSLVGAKTGDPRSPRKNTDHPQAELGLSHI